MRTFRAVAILSFDPVAQTRAIGGRHLQRNPAGPRCANTSGAALQQLKAHLRLQFGDLLTQRGLCDMNGCCWSREC